MTAAPLVPHNKIPEVLRFWQAEAVQRWKHIDPALLAVNGPIWKAMSGVLKTLNVETSILRPPLLFSQTASDDSGNATLSSSTPALLESLEALIGFAALPTQETGHPIAAMDPSLQTCAEQLAALPIAWADLRPMLRLLGAQIRRVSLEHDAATEDTSFVFTDGILEALAANVADIEIARLEQQIASHQEQTLATQHLAERFLGNASHELRTPLTAIMGFAELLLEETYGALTPEQAERVSNIENSAQNLNEIISNMLDLLHIRAGKLPLQYRPVDVADMLQHLYLILMPLAGRKNVRFQIELAEDLGTVEMAENIVRHVVYHLLSSALRATPAGGEVILRARRELPRLVIEARDTALHLPPEAIANMLSPFPRLENSPTRGYEGWEVGLPLVRRYVELHQGELRMESLPENGTVFTVLLPLTRPREERSKAVAMDGKQD